MCGLIEHIEREIRAREAEKLETADVEQTTKEG
jgi:hypothetical protein